MNLQIARHIIQNAGSLRDFRIAGDAHGLKAHPAKSIGGVVGGQSMLQRQTKRAAKSLDQTWKSWTFFAHLDEDFTRSSILKQTDGEIALVSRDAELMGLTFAGFRKNFAAVWKKSHGWILELGIHRFNERFD